MKPKNDAWRPLFLCAAVLAVAAPLRASDRATELPDMDSFRERLKDQPAPQTVAGAPAGSGILPGGCYLPAPRLDFTIQWKALSLKSTFLVKSRGEDFGRIVAKPGGYAFLSNDGNPIAQAVVSDKGPAQLVFVSDACGRKVGEVLRTSEGAEGARSFQVLGADGALLAASGPMGYESSEIFLRDSRGAALSRLQRHRDYLLRSRWQVQGEPALAGRGARLDWRLAAMALLSNLEADGVRSRELEREDHILLYP